MLNIIQKIVEEATVQHKKKNPYEFRWACYKRIAYQGKVSLFFSFHFPGKHTPSVLKHYNDTKFKK